MNAIFGNFGWTPITMQSNTEGTLMEIIELAHLLRQEQLFIASEQNAHNSLSETVVRTSSNVVQLAWICAQQRQNLNSLIVSHPESGPSLCCLRANLLENTKFVDAYKAKSLKYQHVLAYIDLFNYLHRSPYLLAQSLAIGDRLLRLGNNQMTTVVQTIANGLYGNAIHSKDIEMVLKLLRELIEIQIVVSDNPRRMLRAGSCAFARLYHRLHESLFSAKLFLTATLHEPVMRVLINDEHQLDVDPIKAMSSFSSKECAKRFGVEGTDAYMEKVKQYREDTINALVSLANQFIRNLTASWGLFPSTLRWLVQTMCDMLKRSQFTDKDINEILTDMVFTHFICPAVVSPDVYGISDAPISENARFNLIQIGQIFQMLALIKHEDVDPKFMELYDKLDQTAITGLLDQLLVSETDGMMGIMTIPYQNDISRDSVLVTHTELNNFVDFLRLVLDNDGLVVSGEDRRRLGKILEQLPDKFENIVNGDGPHNYANTHASNSIIVENGSRTTKLIKSTKNKLAKSISLGVDFVGHGDEGSPNGSGHNHNNNIILEDYENVLIIPINLDDENKFHLMSEDEVLKLNNHEIKINEPILADKCNVKLDPINSQDAFDDNEIHHNGHQKHPLFSINDDASIGNTSDNLEAVSEVPSNHSVTSSLEMEENDQNLNDNLSDMVSANVSGRGSPNISGRDTPSSQVTESDVGAPQIPTPQMAKILNKARSDIEDKFCKFEINKLMEGDETISIISDTWSTDVLASDSETIDTSERERNFATPLIPSAVVLPGDNNFDPLSGTVIGSQLDAAETHSESAWSTDVLASDSEKMGEVDTDDNQSITARSDITDAGGRSEVDQNLLPHELSLHNRGAPDSPFFAPRIPSVNFRAPDSPMYAGKAPDSPFFSGQSDEMANASGAPNEYATNRFPSPSTRSGTPRYQPQFGPIDAGAIGGGSSNTSSSYQPVYRSNFERGTFLNTVTGSRMRRQNSAESSISNQSSNFDESVSVEGLAKRQMVDVNKNSSSHKESNKRNTENYRLHDFQATGRTSKPHHHHHHRPEVVKTSSNIINPFIDEADRAKPLVTFDNEDFSEEYVEHRRLSTKHRNESFDGRRNGMSEFVGPSTSASLPSSSALAKRTQHLNYENHEIIAQKTASLQMIIHSDCSIKTQLQQQQKSDESGIVDDFLLIQKTQSLSFAHVEPIEGEAEEATAAAARGTSQQLKPLKYTGTIPKSISFDASADKTVRHNGGGGVSGGVRRSGSTHSPSSADHHNRLNGGSFFNKIKQGFKNRRSHKFRSNHGEFRTSVSDSMGSASVDGDGGSALRNTLDNNSNNLGFIIDPNEDILAKYKRKVSSSSEATNSDSVGSSSLNRKSSASDIDQRMPNGVFVDDGPYFFNNAKRKLRVVLSTSNLHTIDFRHTNCDPQTPLLTYLHIQLAQALQLQNLQQVSYVSEAIRCLNSIEPSQQRKLLVELQQDMVERQHYVRYLIRYRQNLLYAIENINCFEERLRNERDMCNRHLIMVCVRMFLEKRELLIEQFATEFGNLTVVDERIDRLNEYMSQLISELQRDGFLHGMVEWQQEEARICIERVLLQRLYRQVMFPNDDGDMSRDEVLREHIRKLSRVISPSHTALRIPQEYLIESPWPFAQQQISYISAYKTPREKVQCVVRCITSIMNLLQMASNRVPSADDLVPVLIYVIIKSNPPYLLSTIEYVNCLVGEKLEGEAHYWWTQFCGAVTFIKTMDYND